MHVNISLVVLAVVSVIMTAFILFPVPVPAEQEPSPDAIHVHASVELIVNGQSIPIPANVGITEGSAENIHTHQWDNILHVHAPNEEVIHRRLGNFFDTWGVPFTQKCLFQFCSGVAMSVNDQPIDDFEEYIIEDQDKIQIVVNIV